MFLKERIGELVTPPGGISRTEFADTPGWGDGFAGEVS